MEFRTPGPWPTNLGRDLTANEVDTNFWELLQAVQALQASAPEPNNIDHFEVNGTQFTVVMEDATEHGPFTLPVATFQPRGTFADGVDYLPLDLVSVPAQGMYLVLQPHEGEAPFDPDRQISGNDVYMLVVDPGPPGAQGIQGNPGTNGTNGLPGEDAPPFTIHASGTFAARAAFDDEAEGFNYVSTDGAGGGTIAFLYQMGAGGSGDWVGPYPWQGPTGPQGIQGIQGIQGTNFDPDAVGLFADRDDHDSEAEGFAYLSTDGAAGGGPPAVIYFHGVGLAVWSAAVPWQGPTGAEGPEGDQGPIGPTGPQGTNFDPDAVGLFAGRAAHDGEATGFSYLSTNGDGALVVTPVYFFKESGTSGDWSPPVPFAGPAGEAGPEGEQGPPGPTGPQGANFQPNATGTFAQRADYNLQAQGFSYLSTNGDGGLNSAASIYIKASATSGDWGPRIPFQGPKGDTGPAGAPGAAGGVGPAGLTGPVGPVGPGVPAGGSTGQILAKLSATNYDSAWVSASSAPLTIGTKPTSYTLASGDEDWLHHADGVVVTIPTHIADPIPVGTRFFLQANGSGSDTVEVDGSAVTLQLPPDATAKARAHLSVLVLTKVSTAIWVLSGDMLLSNVQVPYELEAALSDETTDITTGLKLSRRAPREFYIMSAKASLTTGGSTDTIFDVDLEGVSIFTTRITIDATETTSKTAGTPSNVAGDPLLVQEDDLLEYYIDTAGTDAAGAKVTLIGYYLG